MKKITTYLIAIVFISFGFYFLTNTVTTKEPEIIKFGFVGPLTGDAGAYGNESKNSVQLAVDEINNSGGINGKKIEIVYEDGKCNGKDASSAAQKLVDIDKVKVIFGGFCSGEALAIIPIAEKAGVIQISSGASSPALSGASKMFFRTAPSDSGAGEQLAMIARNNNYKKIAIISENSDYSQALRDTFKKNYASIEHVIVYDETYNPETKDFRSMILKIRSANPDAIFVNPQTDIGSSIIVKQLKDAGMDKQLYANVFPGTNAFLERSATYAEGIIFTDAPGLDDANKKSTDYRAHYEQKYGNEPSAAFYAGAAYDNVYIIKQALEKEGEDTSKISTYLSSLRGFHGVIGSSYGFDENGDLSGIEYKVKTITSGKVIDVK